MMMIYLKRRLYIIRTRTFDFPDGGFYTLTIDDSKMKLDGYTMGSLAGGTGTECAHTVGAVKKDEFFKAMEVHNEDELLLLVDTYKEEAEWSKLHSVMTDFQTDSFVWFETDWDD
jgi:hypothetical protein